MIEIELTDVVRKGIVFSLIVIRIAQKTDNPSPVQSSNPPRRDIEVLVQESSSSLSDTRMEENSNGFGSRGVIELPKISV